MSSTSSFARHRSASNHSGRAKTPLSIRSHERESSIRSKEREASNETPAFEPCAATASHFLFAHESVILCLTHESLALERRFTRHTEDIELISVDNVSERGAGRLVVTYDVGKTAIVWDLFTGEQLSRFASYEPLLVASWMRNGNVAFGNVKGDVILFEPSTSEHVSTRTIYDPLTALAPASDCKTYALGYRNGSVLLATLQPQFTILHTLNACRTPSPIAILTWHASSSKQKSDMLATSTSDGDLRVWSVPKPTASGVPRVIRVLAGSKTFLPGRNWLSWSKNGRVIQYAEDQTLSWDVRTKEVTFERIQVIPYVRSMAAYGPTATLFTLGPESTIQQYNADTGEMVNNVRFSPASIPPTPPPDSARLTWASSYLTSESEGELFSPSWQSRNGSSNQWDQLRSKTGTPASARSRTYSAHSRRSDGQSRPRRINTPGITERTMTPFSQGTQIYSYSMTESTASPAPSARGGSRKSSRLKQQVEPEEVITPALDLFPFTQSRLSDVPYKPAQPPDEERMTSDGLRKQMLSVVFGWEGDIEALIQDELSQHPSESPNAIILMKWLGYDADDLASAMGQSPVDPLLDWMRLALGTLENTPETKKIGQVFVEKMLSKGDIHMAAVVLLTMGDRNDAIEVYVSRNYHMEAVLLACLLMPSDWQRLSHLVRMWGEQVVEKNQQQLAIRCFSCTTVEPTDPWTSPTAQRMNQMNSIDSESESVDPWAAAIARTKKDIVKPHTQPVPDKVQKPSSRMTPQTSALKLITTFGPRPDKYRFPGLQTEEMTPTNPTYVTPIAESAIDKSAITPGGLGSYRRNNARSLGAAGPGSMGSSRHRLPSIGETPSDVDEPINPRPYVPRLPPTPADSGSDKEKARNRMPTNDSSKQDLGLSLLTPARYDPSNEPQTAVGPSSTPKPFEEESNDEDSILEVEARPSSSRARNPGGLSIQLPGSNNHHRSIASDLLTSTAFETDIGSPPVTGNSLRGKTPSVSGRSIDQYISSLDQAQYYSARTGSRNQNRPSKVEKNENLNGRKHSEDQSNTFLARKSPSSPVPMSPDDIHKYNQGIESFDGRYSSTNNSVTNLSAYSGKHRRRESASTNATTNNRHRQRSRSTHGEARLKPSSRAQSRKASPGPEAMSTSRRGRSQSRKAASVTRSPSSPLPMVPSEDDLRSTGNGAEDGALRFVSQNRQRTNRSSSRKPGKEESYREDSSPERLQLRQRSRSRHVEDREHGGARRGSISTKSEKKARRAREARDTLEDVRRNAGSVPPVTEPVAYLYDPVARVGTNPPLPSQQRKEFAQAELEARRISLARRPSAPEIPVPGQNALHSKSASESFAPPPLFRAHTDQGNPGRHYRGASKPYEQADVGDTSPGRDRPTTPRAMERPIQIEEESAPDVPDRFETLSPTVYGGNPKVDTRPMTLLSNSGNPYSPPDMPVHPAYDFRVTGRNSSRGRGRGTSPDQRGKSRSRTRKDQDEPIIVGTLSADRYSQSAYIPELQHLAVPPPPPPPPVLPNNMTRIQAAEAFSRSASVPLPKSIYSAEPRGHPYDKEKGHRRDKSGNEPPNQFMGKIRDMAGKVRSASRNRDNLTRSPPLGGAQISAPYETIIGQAPQSLATVLESRI